MTLYQQKYTSLCITRSKQVLCFECKQNGQMLTTVMLAEYPGITINKKVSRDSQAYAITAKASKNLGFLRQNIEISYTQLRQKAYLVFIRLPLDMQAL